MLVLQVERRGFPGRPLSVLVVDDDPPIRRLLSSLLARSLDGYSVALREAVNGEEALEWLRKERFDLVITDYRMGRVNGVDVLEAASRLQSDAARVLITGYADVPVAVDGVNRGKMECFVPKPWDNSRFVALLSRLMDERGPTAPGGATS